MVRTAAALFVAFALSACASAAPHEDTDMRSITAGSSTTLHQGETVRLPDGATLKYIDVPQDSRCPPNARCIRAGDADIRFEFATSGGTTAPMTANLPEAPSKNMGAWRLTVEALAFGEVQPVTVRIDPAQ